MSERLKALREKRGKIVADMRTILDEAEKAKRSPNAEEEARHDALFKEQEQVGKDIEREERQLELDRKTAESRANDPKTPSDPEKRTLLTGPRSTPEYRKAFDSFLRGGHKGMSSEEVRALQADASVTGGYIVTPEQFIAELIKAIDNEVFIRRKATKIPVPNAQSLGVPTLETDPDDADWTSELATGNEDSAMAFGKRQLTPHPLAKRIKVSEDLLRMALIGAEPLVIARLAYKFGIAEEKGFLIGSGAQQPLGLFVASNNGIPTSRDMATDNTTTAITFDGLINAKYSVKAQYWKAAEWLFHRDAVKMITKLKDSEGQYLWRQSVREGEPDTILGHPLSVSEYVPNTFTAGLYVGLFGDFSKYWIADAYDVAIRRLDELYAETNQVGFIGRKKTDGAPVLAEAFARVTLAP
jgi:HK97 family phage major capsid protein